MSSEPTPINPRNGNNANIGEGLIWTGKTTGCLVTSKPVNTCSNTDGFPLKDTSWSRERRHQMTRRSKTTGKRETWRKPKTSHPVDKKSPGNSMGYAQSAKTHSSMMRSCKCITRNQKPKGERTTTATSSWYTIFAINKSTQRRRWKMSYRGREVRDLLERLEGRLSRAVLRGLRGSNAHSATRLLLKWNHQCAYCDARAVPLELDHICPRSRNGSNRVSNLTLACTPCNQRKGNQDVREFLHDDPARLARILAHLKAPLGDAAAVNATRWALYARIRALGLPVEGGSGGLTKYNRVRRGLEKTHWLDAANVGRSTPTSLIIKDLVPWQITATGHGSRQMCLMDKYGFPRTGPKQHKRVQGFQTGDLVRAVATSGTKQGTSVGKVAVRTRGRFNITTGQGLVTDIHHRFCVLIARSDGYTYQQRKEAALPPTA